MSSLNSSALKAPIIRQERTGLARQHRCPPQGQALKGRRVKSQVARHPSGKFLALGCIGAGVHLLTRYGLNVSGNRCFMFRTALALFVALSCCLVLVGIPPSVFRFEIAVAAPTLVPAQLSQDTHTYSVRGTVVNSVTGEGIRGALVQTHLGRQRAQLTGPDGKFELDNVPAGQAWFNVQKPGYFAPQQITPSARQYMV